MISVEDKINIFQQELNEQLEEFRNATLSASQEEARLQEEQADQEIKEQNQAIKDRYNRLVNRNVAKILAQGRAQGQEIILSTKKELMADFKELVIQRTREIIRSSAYRSLFRKNLEEASHILGNEGVVKFFISDEERELFEDDIHSELSGIEVEFRTLPEKKLGGFLVNDQAGRVSYDFSLANLLDENRMIVDKTFAKILNQSGGFDGDQ